MNSENTNKNNNNKDNTDNSNIFLYHCPSCPISNPFPIYKSLSINTSFFICSKNHQYLLIPDSLNKIYPKFTTVSSSSLLCTVCKNAPSTQICGEDTKIFCSNCKCPNEDKHKTNKKIKLDKYFTHCSEHGKSFFAYCGECKTEFCKLCKKHKKCKDRIDYYSIEPDENKIIEFKERIKNNRKLIQDIENEYNNKADNNQVLSNYNKDQFITFKQFIIKKFELFDLFLKAYEKYPTNYNIILNINEILEKENYLWNDKTDIELSMKYFYTPSDSDNDNKVIENISYDKITSLDNNNLNNNCDNKIENNSENKINDTNNVLNEIVLTVLIFSEDQEPIKFYDPTHNPPSLLWTDSLSTQSNIYKNIYFLCDYQNGNQRHFSYDFLNANNCNMFIDDKPVPFSKSHIFTHEGTHKVTYKIKSPLTSLKAMFCDCCYITQVDLTNFQSQNVTDTSFMFNGCLKLKEIKMNNFDFSNVKDASWMFSACNGLNKFDWNFSKGLLNKLDDCSFMFCACMGIEELDLSEFQVKNECNVNYMFSGCYLLKKAKCCLKGWNVFGTKFPKNVEVEKV